MANERADIVLIGRAMLADPAWPLRAAKALGAQVEWPVEYEHPMGTLGGAPRKVGYGMHTCVRAQYRVGQD